MKTNLTPNQWFTSLTEYLTDDTIMRLFSTLEDCRTDGCTAGEAATYVMLYHDAVLVDGDLPESRAMALPADIQEAACLARLMAGDMGLG